MTKKPDDRPWADIRRSYEETDEPIPELCGRYGITTDMLYARIKRDNWKRRNPRDRPRREKFDALARLKRLTRRKIELLEQQEQSGEGDTVDAAAIDRMSALARLLERISTLEQKEKAAERTRRPPRLVDDARRLELARRLDALRRQIELEENQPKAQGS